MLRALALVFVPLLLTHCTSIFADDSYSGNFVRVTVERGDTVSGIATRFHVRQDDIVAINNLRDRDTLYTGQVLKLPAYSSRERSRLQNEPSRTVEGSYEPVAYTPKASETVWWQNLSFDMGSTPDAQFLWPVKGTVISPYGEQTNGERNDGINIAVPEGAPILASEAGTVTYIGNELKGYGNLLLIHHDNGYMTAYAHADQVAVTRGQHVARGEIIAYAGASGGVGAPQLHFEIRRGTTPVDPKPLLIASR